MTLTDDFTYSPDPSLPGRLEQWIDNAAEDLLFPINIDDRAAELGIPRPECISLFVHAIARGWLRMEWRFHCPSCGGVAHESLTLHEATETNYCPSCRVDFKNTLDSNVEVFFTAHPGKKSPSPELQKRRAAQGGAPWNPGFSVFGSEIIQNSAFREMMGDETLPPDQSLELMKTTILFTDIRESTRMYSALGDARAYHLVRDHFRILFAAIEEQSGIAVKTIGDAVMGSFTDEGKALVAAFETQKRIQQTFGNHPESERISVKIGVHSGPTIVVTLNGRLDYFGTAVNAAARIQSMARADEVVMSKAIFEKDENRKIVAKYAKKALRETRTLKGLEGTFELYHVSVSPAGRHGGD